MKTLNPFSKLATRPRASHFPALLTVVWLAQPMLAQAQFIYTTNSGAVTIIGYTGSGGAVVIPAATNGYPVTSIGDEAFFSHQ